MPIDDRPPEPLFDADFYRRYCESCRRLGVEPVTRERADEFVETWRAVVE